MTARFYTGSYGHKGETTIQRIQFDPAKHTWQAELLDTQAECPSYLLAHPNETILYAVRELTEEGALYTFAVDGSSLRLLSELPTLGKDPCYLSLDSSGKFLFVVNYTGGSLAVFRLDAHGIPQKMTQLIHHAGSGSHPIRQAGPHPHCAVPTNRGIFVCDLGADLLYEYTLDKAHGTLCQTRRLVMPTGCGPRHLCIQNDMMYIVGELSSQLFVVPLNSSLSIVQTLSTLSAASPAENIAAAIHSSDDGKAIFVSNRGDDSIAVFRVLPDGTLEPADICKTGGKTPRDFAVFGQYLIVANQDSDKITALKFDPVQYKLFPIGARMRTTRPAQILKLSGMT